MKKLLLGAILLFSMLNINAQKLPKGFEKSTDKFTSVSTLKYSYKLFGGTEVIGLSKDTKSQSILLSLSAYSTNMVSDQNIGQERQVIVLFSDGATYNAGEQKVYSGTGVGGLYRYSVYVAINNELLEILKIKKIVSYRIGSFDYDVSKKGIDLNEQISYIISAEL